MADSEQPSLPPELITAILLHLAPQDSLTVPTLLACSLVSSTFCALARQAAVWRPLAHWKRGTLLQPNEDAHQYYKRRTVSDLEALSDVSKMADSGIGRLPLLEGVRTLHGEQVVEILSRKSPEEGETWMTERYWMEQARAGIARDAAVQIWKSIQSGEFDEAVGFERGAAAFAAFRGADPFGVLARYDISRHQPLLDTLAISTEGLSAEAALPRIARETCKYMTELGLRPANSQQFHHIDNHFLNFVWDCADAGSTRGTLPMSLVAIFCALIRRLPDPYDVQARPIGFPGLLLAGVANRGQENWIYINVFSGGDVLNTRELSSLLSNMGGMSLQPEYLRPATAKEMCHRISRNILTSVRTAEDPHPNDPLAATASLYAVATSLFILSPPGEPIVTYANWIVQLAQAEFSSDVSFIEKEVIATYSSPGRMAEVAEICEAIRDEDAGEMDVARSRESIIKWSLGHVFRHRLFGYIGVIRGYDLTCEASEQWIQAMQVDTLAYGRHQPFYHVLVNGSSRYVAQENITHDQSVPLAAYNQLKDNVAVGRYFRKPEIKEGGRRGFAVSEEVRRMYPDG